MLTLIYASAILVALVLRHQERRHRLELMRAYERVDKILPQTKPKLPMLESWLNVLIGVILTGTGGYFLWISALGDSKVDVPSSQWEFSAIVTAVGLSLLLLGGRSLLDHRRYKRSPAISA